jgi:uncharacterized protein (DUF433 family)
MNDRISIDHRIMGGAPCITATRIPVATVLGLLGQGYSLSEVVEEHPALTKDDILASLRFAAQALDQRELPLRLTP